MKLEFTRAEFVGSAGTAASLPEAGVGEIAFCGRSNVGKSTLLNRLCGRKSLARVSSTPGKTTTVNYFSLPGGVSVVDLPGYGYARRSLAEKRRWGQLMEAYFGSGRPILLVLQLLDSRHDPSEDDYLMLDFLEQTGIPYIAVLTKTDKLKKSELAALSDSFAERLQGYSPKALIPFSSERPESAPELREKICDFLDECGLQ